MRGLRETVRLGGMTVLFLLPPPQEDPAQLERRWAGIQNPGPRLGIRDLFGFALSASAANWHPERVERALDLAARKQDRDPRSRTYGNFAWYWKDEKPDDLNAVEFCMQQGVLVWMLYRERLTPAARERLDELIRFGLEGVRRRGVKPGYTNIFLMHCWNLMAIGEATGRPEAAQEGYRAFDDWLRYTARNGISEFLSPTYYGVDLECLGLIARHVKQPEARKKAEAALRLFWTDIAANWFEPGGRLGGAHSRDYDYLTGHGLLDRFVRAAGWLPPAGPSSLLDDLCRWVPPPSLVESLRGRVPRVVCQRWGGRPWEAAVHYCGRSVSLGSSGACKGPEDKIFTFQFAGGPRQVMGNFVMDGRGDPYGVHKAVTGGGHLKSHHLVPFAASVQRGPEVLLLVSDASRTGKSGNVEWALVTLASDVVFPADARVLVGETPADPPGPGKERVLPAGEPVFLRFGDAAVGLRFVLALDTGGRPAPVRWIDDGRERGASRFACVHSEAAPQGRGTVALWARAGEGLDEAGFAGFRRRFAGAPAQVEVAGDRVDVAVEGLRGRMRLAADVGKGERLVREGGEPAAEDALLWVDGRDYGREILREALPGAER